MKNNKIFHIYFIFFVILLISVPSLIHVLPEFNKNLNNAIHIEDAKKAVDTKLKSSDIAGSDLYAEKISAYIAGSNSIIKQSLFTNDTNIINKLDLNDPAFEKCSIYLSVSNAINPEIFPWVLINERYPNEFSCSLQSFTGLIYYDEDLSQEQVDSKLERALDILRSKFKIDLIMVNITNPNFFGFVGYNQDWDFYLNEMISNFPMDGYWKALDLDRLTASNYSSNFHLSSTYILINSVEFIEEEINISTDQLYYNLDTFDLSISDSIVSDFSQILGMGGENDSSTNEEEFSEEIGGTSLLNNSHYSYFSVQYEGKPEGILSLGDSQYEFNLWKAMGYEGAPLSPSEKVYIALVGAFISEINIHVLCSDVISSVPDTFEFSDYLIEQIGLLSSLAGGEFDIESLKNYTFQPYWVSKDGLKTNGVKPINEEDPNDVVNALQLTGFQGLETLPTGLLNPVKNYNIHYNTSKTEENIKITQRVVGNNASNGVLWDFTLNITAENVGNKTVWGIKTPYLLELIDIEQLFGEEIYDELWDYVQIYYPEYTSLEEFLNIDEAPRLFYFDTFGDGVADQYYPSLTLTNLFPYSKEMPQLIDYMYYDNQFLYAILNPFSDNFTNPDSIWNKDNWNLEPGELISYEIQNIDISNLDSYHEFHRCNFVVDSSKNLPETIRGTTYGATTPKMAQSNDMVSWIILSEKQYQRDEIELNLAFQNTSVIDLRNNKLDNISLFLNLSVPESVSDISFQAFNFTTEEFVDIDRYLSFSQNDTRIYSFLRLNYSIDWLFDSTNNYTMLFKIQASNESSFNLTLNEVKIRLSQREINFDDREPIILSFSNEIGTTYFNIESNSILLSTYDMASIIAYSSLSEHNSSSGAINEYFITIRNIGSFYAKNVNISVIIPGIIEDNKDFTIYNNNLSYFIPYLYPEQELRVSFTFYNPNSASISGARIKYHNPRTLEDGASTELITYSNEVSFSAPVDYINNFPFLKVLNINITNLTNAPKINSSLTLNISLKNISPNKLEIEDVTLRLNDQFGSLHVSSPQKLVYYNIKYGQVESNELDLEKRDWKGYFYPSIVYILGKESKTIQISNSNSVVIGDISLMVEKNIEKQNIRVGELVEVSIKVTNTGTITIRNVEINDANSFSSNIFSLYDGKLVNEIGNLDPGQTKVVSYTIKAKIQSESTFQSASVQYYYILEKEQKSNDIKIKVITPPLLQYIFLLIPSIISIISLTLYYRQQHGYRQKQLEMQRYESSLLKLTSRDSIFKVEHTLNKRLDILSNMSYNNEKSRGDKNDV